MITTHPSVAEVDATLSLLSVLELAKDASKLKTALLTLKAEQDDLADAQKKHDNAVRRAQEATKRAEEAIGKSLAEKAAASEELARVAAGFADLEAAREAMKAERDAFDRWMAGERDALSRRVAEVDSKAVQNEREGERLTRLEATLQGERQKLQSAMDAVAAKGDELDAKLNSLKAMVA